MEWLVETGAAVYTPLVGNPDVDLVAILDDRVVPVQVKTSTCRFRDRWAVALCTRGGNQSWSGIVKHLDASRCDALFVHVGDGRRWYLPMAVVEGTSGLTLGGPKYSEYEIDPGRPLPARPKPEIAAQR
jgi:hypothetical protein